MSKKTRMKPLDVILNEKWFIVDAEGAEAMGVPEGTEIVAGSPSLEKGVPIVGTALLPTHLEPDEMDWSRCRGIAEHIVQLHNQNLNKE
jgi:hypothetical protein